MRGTGLLGVGQPTKDALKKPKFCIYCINVHLQNSVMQECSHHNLYYMHDNSI